MKSRPASFDYNLDFRTIDFRKHPELYRIGKGEQGVMLVEPIIVRAGEAFIAVPESDPSTTK
jgi:hypothetical protein